MQTTTAAGGVVSMVMVMAVTGVYFSKHHPHLYKQTVEGKELPADVPIIIKLDGKPVDETVFYNKIIRSIRPANIMNEETLATTPISTFDIKSERTNGIDFQRRNKIKEVVIPTEIMNDKT